MSTLLKSVSSRVGGALLACFSLVSSSLLAQSPWVIDQAHSGIGFSVSHMVVSDVSGRFKSFGGLVVSKSADFNGAEVEFNASVTSIDTDDAKRDEHLRGEDFFNIAKFPKLSFRGTLSKTKDTAYQLKGTLTIKGIAKEVTLAATYRGTVNTGNGSKAGFKVTGVINRQDFDLTWSKVLESGGLMVGNEISILCNIELNKQG